MEEFFNSEGISSVNGNNINTLSVWYFTLQLKKIAEKGQILLSRLYTYFPEDFFRAKRSQ